MNGDLITTELTKINIGFEEFVAHSYYDDWTSSPTRYSTDPFRHWLGADIEVEGIALRQPKLDEVFLALTGQSMRLDGVTAARGGRRRQQADSSAAA